MTSPSAVLQAADGAPLDAEEIVAGLSARFAVVSGPRQVLRRAHLDTFDRRLHAAGLTLQHQTSAGAEQLLLEGRRIPSMVSAAVQDLRWPALAGALPDGPLRDAVAPVSDIRALMVFAEEKRRVRRLDLHNDDGKTVARIELDEPATSAGSPGEVVVRALRGYEDQARKAAQLLTGLGLRSAERVEDQPVEDAPAAEVAERSAPATVLLASVFGDFAAAMRANLPGLLADVDTEFLHDFRVAVRRTRSTLKLGRPALPEEMRNRWEPAFKWLGDLTTPVRDLDVYELDLPTMAGWLVAAAPGDLEPFAAHLRRRRAAERRSLLRALRSAKFERLLGDWEQSLPPLAATPQAPHDRLSAGQLADSSVSRAYRRVARGGAAITVDSPAEDLHDLRKRCKELRYALEVFAPVIDKAPRRRAITDLKALQDVLGRFQDSEVQRQALRAFAEEMVAEGTPAGAVLAMGELIGHLDAEQDRARDEFGSAFAHFTRPASHEWMHRLEERA